MNKMGEIAVGMSGGLDSSVAALLLKEQGYDVVGVNLNLWTCFKSPAAKTCCSPEDRKDARNVCETLGIPFVSVDMREEFKERVVAEFAHAYSAGKTPNPCIRCNTLIKFESLLTWLEKEMAIKQLATGHYARVIRDEKGRHLLKGKDINKDQTYFLFDMPKGALDRLYFPLGNYLKDGTRKIAKEAGLPVATKAESQEICFVADGEVASFIEDYFPTCAKSEGNFVDQAGRVLGKHRGIHAYTIGQRRGLGIGFGERKYVTKLNPKTDEVTLGDDKDLFTDRCVIQNINILEEGFGKSFEAEVKVRYSTKTHPARVFVEGNSAEIKFNEPVRAITPGQAAVFYKDELVIGGGWII